MGSLKSLDIIELSGTCVWTKWILSQSKILIIQASRPAIYSARPNTEHWRKSWLSWLVPSGQPLNSNKYNLGNCVKQSPKPKMIIHLSDTILEFLMCPNKITHVIKSNWLIEIRAFLRSSQLIREPQVIAVYVQYTMKLFFISGYKLEGIKHLPVKYMWECKSDRELLFSLAKH